MEEPGARPRTSRPARTVTIEEPGPAARPARKRIERPCTAPEPGAPPSPSPHDVADLFDQRQLVGRQLSWEAVRQATAELARPAGPAEIVEVVWRQYEDYCGRVGCPARPRGDKFNIAVLSLVESSLRPG